MKSAIFPVVVISSNNIDLPSGFMCLCWFSRSAAMSPIFLRGTSLHLLSTLLQRDTSWFRLDSVSTACECLSLCTCSVIGALMLVPMVFDLQLYLSLT